MPLLTQHNNPTRVLTLLVWTTGKHQACEKFCPNNCQNYPYFMTYLHGPMSTTQAGVL